MIKPVVFRLAAQREFDQAIEWYEARWPGLGHDFLAEITHAVELIAESPARYPIVHRDLRCIRVRRFPYSVFFREETKRLVVLAVFHARRAPVRWQERA